MTNDEINRKISELKEPQKPDYHPVVTGSISGIQVFTDRTTATTAWVYRFGVFGSDQKGEWQPRNWTSDEVANAELLEEMPEPIIWKESATLWGCEADGNKDADLVQFDPGRKTAIALAWLKWKQS